MMIEPEKLVEDKRYYKIRINVAKIATTAIILSLLGMIVPLLLISLEIDFNVHAFGIYSTFNYFLLIGMILAGLILSIVAFILLSFEKNRTKMQTRLVLLALVIGVLPFAINYFFFSNTGNHNIPPDQCPITSGFTCRDFQVQRNIVRMSIISNMGENIDVSGFKVSKSGADPAEIVCTGLTEYSQVADGGQFELRCENLPESWELKAGSKTKLQFEFQYALENDIKHNVTGTITATVQ